MRYPGCGPILRNSLSETRPARRTLRWLVDELGVVPAAAEQLVEYLRAGHAALGCLPTQQTIVLERFFDEAGGMQLVVHSPYGSRINRAWGLALRKRFCRKFNFELQAAATEDNIVISLTEAHSFPLDEVVRYLHSASVRTVLTQALLDSPMFTTRWRWVVGVSLALPRFRAGKKVPPQLARMGAEDLIGAVFPDQIACAENLQGEREIPDHPLVNQAIDDSLTEAMDIEGLERLLKAIESGIGADRGARPHATLAACPGSADGAALCLSRRCAARRAPHPGGDGAALDFPGGCIRSRPPRSGGYRAGARRDLAASRKCRRAARRTGLARVLDRCRKSLPSPAGVVG